MLTATSMLNGSRFERQNIITSWGEQGYKSLQASWASLLRFSAHAAGWRRAEPVRRGGGAYHGSNVGYFVDPDDNRYDDVVPGQSETSGVILFDSIFQGLAISLMAGEVAFPLLSRMTVPILYYLSATQGARAAG
jgi:hypothetical protein